jgi:hypothetical protein
MPAENGELALVVTTTSLVPVAGAISLKMFNL